MSLWIRGILGFAAFWGMVYGAILLAFPIISILKWDHKPSVEEKDVVRSLKFQVKKLYKENQRDKAKEIEEQINKIQKTNPENDNYERKVFAIYCALIGVYITALISIPFKIFSPDISLSRIFKTVYLLFGAPFLLAAVFELLDCFKEKDGNNHRPIYAAVIYYGTFFIRRFLADYVNGNEIILLLVSAIIMILICVIFWLISQKDKK